MNKIELLKQHFGFDTFRPIQEQAIDMIVSKKDLLTILPTGSGKSLIFQMSGLLLDGITVVISPLIALMQDQVINLKENNISAEMLSSQNTNEQNDIVLEKLKNNEIKFLYIAPERFANEYFKNTLRDININFFVIDEAHCVSEWGHEFRDDYRKLSNLKQEFPNIPICAFTATATKNVQEDILKTLSIDFNNVLKAKIKRDNLLIRVQKRIGDGKVQIKQFLNTHIDECGIIYCFTRKETENLSSYLNENGFNTKAYHAGINSKEKEAIFTQFKNEDIKIIVATIAFGMGIDKGNIRFVLHTSMPKTIENYSQEIGRAGRDGLNSDVLLLYSKADEISKKKFIDVLEDSTYKQNNYKKLDLMYRFAISSKCRHQFIASYFDDDIEQCKSICDNCTQEEQEYKDISVDAQKFLSCILRTNQRFGQNYIIDVLRGSSAKRILEFEHQKLSVHGIGKHYSKDQWSSIADTLLDINAIIIQGEYRTLSISDIGFEILKSNKNVKIPSSHLVIEKSYDQYKSDIIIDEIFLKFKDLRTKIAKESDVPPYVVFSDKVLDLISKKLPSSNSQFLEIPGIGQSKLDKYADSFISLSKELKSKNDVQTKEDTNEKKDLSKTYLETLHLIQENKTFEEIVHLRELQNTTIISHITNLYQHNYINEQTKNKLLEVLKNDFPNDIKEHMQNLLKTYDIKTLRQYIAQYDYLFLNEDK